MTVISESAAWVRLFNRLDAAVTHHQTATAGLTSEADEALYKARTQILADAALPIVTATSRSELRRMAHSSGTCPICAQDMP